LSIFQKYPAASQEGLPFGVALYDHRDLWFAQHIIDKIGLLDSSNRQQADIALPIIGSYVQWLAADHQVRNWFAEQRGSAVGSVSMISKPSSSSETAVDDSQNINQPLSPQGGRKTNSAIPHLNFDFLDILGPLIAAGIVTAAALYSKNVIDLKRNIAIAKQSQEH
jgi:copper transport protein